MLNKTCKFDCLPIAGYHLSELVPLLSLVMVQGNPDVKDVLRYTVIVNKQLIVVQNKVFQVRN